jgi:hypothetical protein
MLTYNVSQFFFKSSLNFQTIFNAFVSKFAKLGFFIFVIFIYFQVISQWFKEQARTTTVQRKGSALPLKTDSQKWRRSYLPNTERLPNISKNNTLTSCNQSQGTIFWSTCIFLVRLKGYLVNCLEHFFLLFFCLQIMFPQLFALFQILFLLSCRKAVEMLFFSLLTFRGIRKSPIKNQSRRQGVSYLTACTMLVNLVHSAIDLFVLHRRHYLAPRLRRGAAFIA